AFQFADVVGVLVRGSHAPLPLPFLQPPGLQPFPHAITPHAATSGGRPIFHRPHPVVPHATEGCETYACNRSTLEESEKFVVFKVSRDGNFVFRPLRHGRPSLVTALDGPRRLCAAVGAYPRKGRADIPFLIASTCRPVQQASDACEILI